MIKNKFFKEKIFSYNKNKKPTYNLTRFVILRVLAFVYLFAFLSLAFQVVPLLGEHGLLPAKDYINYVGSHFESKTAAFFRLPSIFWFNISDGFLVVLAWGGAVLSLIVLFGFANIPIMALLCSIYMSFVHIGQVFYGYGWEIQLLETGFLAIFLCPLWDARPFPKNKTPVPVIWLFKWLAFRIYLGSGLIKIRGDECWRNLTCLYYHYETQPIPNPLSPYFHFTPRIILKFGVLWNHFIELIVPFFVFFLGIIGYVAGTLLITFQIILIIGGNYSFLNWITIVPCIACFDDNFFRKILPNYLVKKSEETIKYQKGYRWQNIASWALVILITFFSLPVVKNLVSQNQYMNTSFNQWEIVNTYGAFGSVGKTRYELVVEGTEEKTITKDTKWKEYEFFAKPTNINRRLPIIAPYQPRIDWQIWFAAMETPNDNPWLIHLIWKFLHNDKGAVSLISSNPFKDKPPEYIRVSFYEYEFNHPGGRNGVWSRKYLGEWLPPLSASNPDLQRYIAAYGWKD